MTALRVFVALSLGLVLVFAPPPNRQQAAQQDRAAEAQQEDQKPMYEFAFSKYLEQVIKILEADPKFQERVRGMKEDDIKAGKIADHIDDLGPEVFDELTKAKMVELERIREQISEDIKKAKDPSKIPVPEHIDVYNWEKFHKEDLRKLITKTVSTMEEIDRQRRESFKEYEMKKKAEEDHKLAQLPPEQREQEKHKLDESHKRHNEHQKLKHPGDREQLEEMDKDSFDPRTFFALHDLNGDGFWNNDELEALFQIELAKLYNETDPDDDPKEKVEEMYRMREHVLEQMDKNKDHLISLQEFLSDNEATVDDNKDEGWKDLAEQDVYSADELKRFEEEYAREQGWGEHAYDPITAAPPNLDKLPPVPVQPVQTGQNINQPHYQQQPVQVQPQVPQGQQQYQPPPPPPVRPKVDPHSGI